jgi:hypothetical protein
MTTAEADRESAPPPSPTEASVPARDAAARLPLLLFAIVEGAAFAYYLVLAHTQWFFADEWEFLAGRGLNVHDLLRAHYGHWVAVPVVVYRVLWAVVGLRSYLPYAAVTIALHLTAAALLLVIMRRSGVRPWTSALVASVFVLFGAGAQDLLWAFQVTFTGALVLGLTQLLCADHDGPVDRRDWLGMLAGLLALMCSGVAVTMVIVVGIAALLRRGWRVAALHTVPLAIVYGAWWARYSHGKYTFGGTPREILDWSISGGAGVFGALGQIPGVGWAVGLILVCGIGLVLRARGAAVLRERLSMPAALLIGAIAFLVIAGYDRGAVGASFARSSRYLHMLAALAIPAIAVAIDAIVDRSKLFGSIALAALLVGIPGNLAYARDRAHRDEPRAEATRQLMLSIPRMALARRVPRELRPEPNLSSQVTVGWLLDGVASGRLPTTPPPSPTKALANRLRLSLMELDRSSDYPCRALSSPTVVKLEKGAEVGLGRGNVLVVLVSGSAHSTPVGFGRALLNPGFEHTLVAVTGPLVLRFIPGRSQSAELCTPVRH